MLINEVINLDNSVPWKFAVTFSNEGHTGCGKCRPLVQLGLDILVTSCWSDMPH